MPSATRNESVGEIRATSRIETSQNLIYVPSFLCLGEQSLREENIKKLSRQDRECGFVLFPEGKKDLTWNLAQATVWQPSGYRLRIEADLAQFLGRNNYFTFNRRNVGEFGDILAIDDIKIYSGVCVPNSE